ncbi:MAG TPA: hypothetical protein VE987_11605 [Polyangiaceae bacterium]|nr:hypothetical protein [Polyangiaceae bacterium]
MSSPLPEAYARAYLALARAALERDGGGDDKATGAAPLPQPAPPPPVGARRVVLSAWRAGQAYVETANGPTFADGVRKAAAAMAMAHPDAAAGRLEIDVPTVVDRAGSEIVDEDMEVAQPSLGLEGVLVTRDDGKTGVVLPGDIVRQGMFRSGRLDHARIGDLLAERAAVGRSELGSMRAYRFRADTHVETPGHDGALAVVRGMVAPPDAVTPEALLARVRRGADYLLRVMGPSGRYVYLYRPLDDRDDPSYGWLRHAGTTYALLEAYEEFRTPAYLEKAELALSYLSSHLTRDAAGGGRYVLDTDDEEQQKVGGAGLSLLAMAEHAAVTARHDGAELETMRDLARFIIKQQYEDGHFRSNADVERENGGRKLKREPVYYPGEAVLSLVRLYGIDPQPAYLEAARKGADYVVNVRDAYVSEDNQEHDHWMSYALGDLYRLTRDEAYLKHAYKIARAILKKQRRAGDAPAPDFAGTFYDGQITPASTRLEAYDADIALSRFAGRADAWLLEPAVEVARSILGQQFDPLDDYWLRNPAKADGGVRESLFVQDVRIDYVQHAMSAWLHLARLLRDPGRDKAGAAVVGEQGAAAAPAQR